MDIKNVVQPGHRVLVSSTRSCDGLHAVDLNVPTGIGTFTLNLVYPLAIHTLVLTIDNRYCECLVLTKATGEELDLRSLPGVSLISEESQITITMEEDALKQLAPGGEVRYINQYRC